ncbi:MAG: sigma-70 family RNA polymerase sigma factor, partial [Candidatus Cloacimonadaceae bacterium]|nr:sigma-70 family RNA polymerase sigma factor [Candidatus Cloacimonadaceae bacterium]
MKQERFEAFLKANEKRIYHYLLTLLGNDNDAKDIVQMVFMSFYEHIDRVEEATALSYLYKIAYNKSMTFLKQRSRYVNLPPQAFEHIPDTGSVAPEKDWSFLHKCVRDLPPRLSSVIMLQYFEELSYKQISDQLGISVMAVESLLVRAKKIL